MAKISRPVIYTFVAAVAAYAGVLLTQPDAPAPTHRTLRLVRHVNANAETETPEDLNAHFARYVGGKRNPFVSGLTAGSGTNTSAGKERGAWALTGINILNGTPSALVENSATGESVFLHAGDRWRGLRVVSIGPGTVSFMNALGQRTHLAFHTMETPAPDVPGASGGPLPPLGTANALPPLPVNLSNIRPLPPFGSRER